MGPRKAEHKGLTNDGVTCKATSAQIPSNTTLYKRAKTLDGARHVFDQNETVAWEALYNFVEESTHHGEDELELDRKESSARNPRCAACGFAAVGKRATRGLAAAW
jgi:hypothetical protein